MHFSSQDGAGPISRAALAFSISQFSSAKILPLSRTPVTPPPPDFSQSKRFDSIARPPPLSAVGSLSDVLICIFRQRPTKPDSNYVGEEYLGRGAVGGIKREIEDGAIYTFAKCRHFSIRKTKVCTPPTSLPLTQTREKFRQYRARVWTAPQRSVKDAHAAKEKNTDGIIADQRRGGPKWRSV